MSNNIPPPDWQPAQPVPPQYMTPVAQPYPAQPVPSAMPPYPAQPYPAQPVPSAMPPYPTQPYAALPYAGQPGSAYVQPYQPSYDANAMTPHRNMLVFVSAILLIVGGALFLLSGIATASLSGIYSSTCSQTGGCDVPTGMFTASSALTLVMGACGVVAGIIGVMSASKPHKANLLLILGIGLCAITIISQIVSAANGAAAASSLDNSIGLGSGSVAVMSIGGGIIDLIVPVLFVVGAVNLKKQAPSHLT